ncbi:PepSY domain-containing protein [Sphingopyxis indica]|uniref:PepSY domain-containing protein n=1 Tax=Sphingopyxis indica TaxID=436663 RepID=UPI0029394390|nr:PepSY domain-containing protein [Sphingopyxis indica]WOF42557.1 PepSY domain-containing protein [Sphingopyxis indica]
MSIVQKAISRSRVSAVSARLWQVEEMKIVFLAALAAVALALPAITLAGDDKADQRAASAALARGEILPIGRVLAIATGRVAGDVLKVKLERESFGFKYEVKILTGSGRVREVEVDARTGRIMKIEED